MGLESETSQNEAKFRNGMLPKFCKNIFVFFACQRSTSGNFVQFGLFFMENDNRQQKALFKQVLGCLLPENWEILSAFWFNFGVFFLPTLIRKTRSYWG